VTEQNADYERGWQDAVTHLSPSSSLARSTLNEGIAGLCRRSADMNHELSKALVALARDQERVAQRLAVIDHPDEVQKVGDAAWHSIWLHGNWRFLTKQMTTEEKEYAADAVEREWRRMEAEDPKGMAVSEESLAHLRWWR
jgi:hypothetical protein